jgi:mono/diheme cytochrome c family protein
MKVPVGLNVVAVVVGATIFYTYIGQLVPQKQIQPPPVIEISGELTPAELAKIGERLARDKGMCLTCHTIGLPPGAPHRYPDLAGVADRAKTRIAGMDQVSYFAHSLCHPDEYLVEGFAKGMPAINKPPIGLTDPEMHAIVAWLQSQGGEPTITLKDPLPGCETAS